MTTTTNDQAQETLKMIKDHPLTRKLEAEKAAQTLAEREQAAAALADAEQEKAVKLPPLQDRIAEIEAEIKAHDLARNGILDRLGQARLAKILEVGRLDGMTRDAETALNTSYDRRIDADLEFFRDRFEAIRQKPINRDTAKSWRNLLTLKRGLIYRSNGEAIQKALGYCRQAIDRLEAMKFEPSYPAAEVEAIKKAIPDTSEMTEYNAEKSIRSEGDANPRWALPSADQFDWQMGKLKEKCRKMGI